MIRNSAIEIIVRLFEDITPYALMSIEAKKNRFRKNKKAKNIAFYSKIC